ncbi:hypothetical protein [Cellulomonas marina]|uniref:hypothetical protein n=1 Tax=Cellulomonas marina TaxID=988821 RepID=UPI0011140E44|nr:hypothetical protein [Cellulomonas marina]
MTRLILREGARWARAVATPLAVQLVVVVAPVVLQNEVRRLGTDRALSLGWLAAVIASLVWLATSATRAAIQPAGDRRAFVRVQELRVLSGLPHHALLCILRTVWSTAAGQRADAVDVRTGAVIDLWLADASLPPGSYALVKFTDRSSVLVDAVPPGLVLAARRHTRREGVRHHERSGRKRRAAARVIRTAETLLR